MSKLGIESKSNEAQDKETKEQPLDVYARAAQLMQEPPQRGKVLMTESVAAVVLEHPDYIRNFGHRSMGKLQQVDPLPQDDVMEVDAPQAQEGAPHRREIVNITIVSSTKKLKK